MSDKIIIFDTTLRDGEQSPGASMTFEQKLIIADILDNMGVDVIEAGFAIASDGDFAAVQAIAKQAKNAVICSLSRAKKMDIEAAGKATKPAKQSRIHTFISTSPIHRQHKLKMSKEQVLEAITDSVTLAKNWTDNVEWSAEDATRTEQDYLYQAIDTAIKAGANTINIPDTVGYATPTDYGRLIADIKNNVANIDKVIISTHCQNDLGLATANSLAGALNGARQIECTINGLGERAGNASLEEVVMALKVRQDELPYTCDIDTTYLARASKTVSQYSGFIVQNNKAIVGANAFAHESGIHQDGMLKHAGTYEIMTPESIGLNKSNLVLGKHSGRHAFKTRLAELGFTLDEEALNAAFERFKTLADRKKEIYDDDLLSLVGQNTDQDARIEFSALEVSCGSKEEKAIAKLELLINKQTQSCTAEGLGPVDATFNAIKQLVSNLQPHLKLYQVQAVTQGTDAQAEVVVRLESEDGKTSNGSCAHTDTLVASAKAYIEALNRLEILQDRIKAHS